MEPAVLLVTDDPERSADVVPILGTVVRCRTVALGKCLPERSASNKAVIFDVDLSNADVAQKLRETLALAQRDGASRIFLAERSSHHARVQAAAFGSSLVLTRPLDREKLLTAIFGPPADLPPVAVSADVREAAEVAAGTMNASFGALRGNVPLDFAAVATDGERIDDAVMHGEINQWIAAVREHHSYTYRHCMLVTGVVAAFSQHLGIGGPCRQRLMRGAMLHDIGKAAIPVAILDKPTKLSEGELIVMRGHPAHGRAFLEKHHRGENEIIEIVYCHHEMLDGSGYPEGRTKIPDAVRLVTICDIYSALIEPRPYKKTSTKEQAYATMEEMGGKLDRDLLRAFKPVALA